MSDILTQSLVLVPVVWGKNGLLVTEVDRMQIPLWTRFIFVGHNRCVHVHP